MADKYTYEEGVLTNNVRKNSGAKSARFSHVTVLKILSTLAVANNTVYTKQPESLKTYKHDFNEFIEFFVPEFDGRLISWGREEITLL